LMIRHWLKILLIITTDTINTPVLLMTSSMNLNQ
jgi:hypothetical protein